MTAPEKNLSGQIGQYWEHWTRCNLQAAGIRFSAILFILWLSVVLADAWFQFSVFSRFGLALIHLLVPVYLFRTLFGFTLRIRYRTEEHYKAQLLGYLSAASNDRQKQLSDLLTLIRNEEQPGESAAFRRAAIESILSRFDIPALTQKLRLATFLPEMRYYLFLPLLFPVMIWFLGDQLYVSTMRMVNPFGDYHRQVAFNFFIEPGETRILRGETLKIKGKYSGPAADKIWLELTTTGGELRERRFLDFQGSNFSLELRNIRESFRYRVLARPLLASRFGAELTSGYFTVLCLQPPELTTIDIRIQPPAYTGLALRRQERNQAELVIYPGSLVRWEALSNKLLQTAALIFDEADSLPLRVNGKTVSGETTLSDRQGYWFILRDEEGLDNLAPIRYPITYLDDLSPEVRIDAPAGDIECQPETSLLLRAEAEDDFGLIRAELVYRLITPNTDSSDWQAQPLKQFSPSVNFSNIEYRWELASLSLAFGDEIEYFIRATDNNTITKPGVGESAVFHIRLPSIDDIFNRFDTAQTSQLQELEEVAQENSALAEKFKELNQELMHSEKPDWQTTERLNSSLAEQEALQNKVQELQNNLAEMVNQLDQQDLLSPDILEKYQELQELFREVLSPELLESIRKLQQNMEQNKGKDTRQTLDELIRRQDEVRSSLERLTELLEKVQLEQKLDQLFQKAENLMNKQEAISEQLKEEKTSPENLNRQVDGQQENQDRLSQDLQDYSSRKALERYPQTTENLAEAGQKLEQLDHSAALDELKNALGNKTQNQSAAKMSEQIGQQYSQVKEQIARAREAMNRQNTENIREKMHSLARQMLQLSLDQESLMQQTSTLGDFTQTYSEYSGRQGQLADKFQRMAAGFSELSRETFLIDPAMVKPLGEAQRAMQQSIRELSERQKEAARQQQEKAMASLNAGVKALNGAMQMLEGGGSGLGFEQFMEQMQQLSAGQGQVNMETMMLSEQSGSSRQGQMGQAMQQLAARQRALQQSLKDLAEQGMAGGETPGRLGDVAGSMDEIISDLLQNKVSRRTIERQQAILSRMLDAQKSVQERDQSEKRKARQPGEYQVVRPGQVKSTGDATLQELEDRLNKALKGDYSPEYKEWIELYFRALIESRKKSG